jgi:uncharacterized protein YcbK (DUF882 family)
MIECLAPALLMVLASGPAAVPDDTTAVAAPAETAKPAAEELVKAQETKVKKSKVKKKKKKKKRRRRCRTYAPPRYKKMVRNWQKVPKIPKPRYREGYRDLTLYSVNLGERVRVFPFLPDGSLDPEAMAQIGNVFRDKDSDVVHEVDPRMVKLLYKLAVRFDSRQITLISGFREPGDGKTEGAHGKGRAADIMIPGVRLPALAKVARRLGHVGVGYYPVSGFIHLDVREGVSYFWSDRSGPGQPGCLSQIMKNHGPRFDRRWSPEDDEPEQKRNKKGELLGAIEEPDPIAEPGSEAAAPTP